MHRNSLAGGAGAIAVVGAGVVGVNASLFLSRLGFEVHLMDSAPDILRGAPATSFINHGDGFEYYKPHHRRTGELCIDGALTKGLIYPLHVFRTRICDDTYPIRFMVSQASVREGEVPLEMFYENAEHMRRHFTEQFEAVRRAAGWSREEAGRRFLRTPESFARRLEKDDLADVSQVAGGYSGSSFGINMPHYFAFVKAALRECGVNVRCGVEIEAIERTSAGYLIWAGGTGVRAEQVVFAAGHQIPALTRAIRGVATTPPRTGTYYLNSMTFLTLPATVNAATLEASRRINFTLQQDNGSMFACVVPPSELENGLAVTYFPSRRGSQLRAHEFNSEHSKQAPAEWDHMIADGLPSDHPNVISTLEQACRIYPFLRDYAIVERTLCRPVFNFATRESDGGGDRRVRDIPALVSAVSQDGRITAWAAPKWTNAELVALMAADYVCAGTRGQGLPKNGETGFGPTRLDVLAIARNLDFSHVTMHVSDALGYARAQGVPVRIVDPSLPQYERPPPSRPPD